MVARVALVLLVIGGAVLSLFAVRGVRAYRLERRQFIPRHATITPPPDARALGLVDLDVHTSDGTQIGAWRIPSRNGATIILCQGSASDRTAMLDDARALSALGFGIVLFDWPGTGESMGRVRYAAPERDALRAVLDLLTAERPEGADIGVYAFSMGAQTAIQVAAADPRIEALVVAGAFDDPLIQTRHEYARYGPFAVWAALRALREADFPERGIAPPVALVSAIAPRPLLVVAGSDDRAVPAVLSRHLHEAARPPKELWIIDGAGHGAYDRADPTYYERLGAFFARALGVTVRADSTAR